MSGLNYSTALYQTLGERIGVWAREHAGSRVLSDRTADLESALRDSRASKARVQHRFRPKPVGKSAVQGRNARFVYPAASY